MIERESWSPADGLILEPNAFSAARETKGCLALTAGPGAGKTEMLAQRADFLLRTGTCKYPSRILAISFKVDASRNLKDRVRKRCGQGLADRFDSFTFHAFAKRIIDRFRPVLTGLDALDPDFKIGGRRIERSQIEFGDLIPLANQILSVSQIARTAIRETYTDVFLDEFQDCTDLQYELVQLAFHGADLRLVAVGDTKQRIMSWAGALEGIFSKFASDFQATPLNLYLNFRSQPTLLRLQNEIIRVLDPTSMMPDEQITGEGGKVIVHGFDTAQAEAEYLADQIEHWIKVEGVPLSEIAVLVSKQLDLYASLLMEELDRRKIPYRNEQKMQDISTEPAACLIVDYLLCLYGSREPEAWLRLMNLLIPFSDQFDQESLQQDWLAFIKAERSAVALLDEAKAGWPSAWGFVLSFLKKVGVPNLTSLSPDYESSTRLNEVLVETRDKLKEMSGLEESLVQALSRFSDELAIRILTIHKSKGLEFESVIIMAMDEQIFFGDSDENRCAFFVGVSRAKNRLVLTYAANRERPTGWTKRWDVHRDAHAEYLGYALPYTSETQAS